MHLEISGDFFGPVGALELPGLLPPWTWGGFRFTRASNYLLLSLGFFQPAAHARWLGKISLRAASVLFRNLIDGRVDKWGNLFNRSHAGSKWTAWWCENSCWFFNPKNMDHLGRPPSDYDLFKAQPPSRVWHWTLFAPSPVLFQQIPRRKQMNCLLGKISLRFSPVFFRNLVDGRVAVKKGAGWGSGFGSPGLMWQSQ